MKKKIIVILALSIISLIKPSSISALCGDVVGGACSLDIGPKITCPEDSSACCQSFAECRKNTPSQDITDDITPETFDALNPLKIAESPVADQLSTPGGIISRILNFLFPLAGLILFFLIVWGGFEILIGASDQKGMEAGKNRITAAIIGFILLFSSYWMTQIVETIFGIRIL